ncbi:hypothetical protein SAMN05444149_108109 [Pseudosulfitobacter pseudonitzschiae]|uniref:Uncharacterized protein n=1 Tax=Pseudosulfitobacter pseudonitzschiae TaxID=1402135 RepID=A0A073J8G3_9RHOB|nr:hypothetical protein [Pseudosulfitobacter pseudonitzschiae]KEJ93992.1 hypothetical protein SUH3_12030 [Pseudosulfitobacter pseudonitzschiae]SHG01899.1 hypothetical protein SAMN05444149_108109 [Pseudosulfitobacter pseudonitzschiae]
MKHYAIIDQDGFVEGAGFGVPPVGAVVVDRVGLADLLLMHVDGEAGLVPRPAIAAPVLDGDSLSLPSGPVGTRLRVVDRVSDEVLWQAVTDGGLVAHVLTLPDPGSYVVDIEPPLPFVPVQLEFVK